MVNVFLLIFGLQILFFAYAAIKKTDKVTDLSYGLTFLITSLAFYFVNTGLNSTYKTILLLIVSIWSTRLAIYLFIRIIKTGKDKRFDGIRENFFKFGSFWLLQAISIFIILLPTSIILNKDISMEFNSISLIGALISIFGIIIESIADQQKFKFKNIPENKDNFIKTGIWKYSRHPNYLGEIMMWVGVCIYCIYYLNNVDLIAVISPIYISILLIFLSGIPTIEKKYDIRYKDNEEYQKYKKNTGLLLPKLF